MSDVERVVRDYTETLSNLERNDKLRINVLTILAEDYAKYSSHIVKIIENSIFEAETNELREARLYLVDSIIKNIRETGNYTENFSDNLVKVFLHVFQRGDEKTRAKLFRLRNTWQGVFPRGKLYSLDVDVHSIDPKWPILPPVKNGNAPQQKKPPPPVTVKSEPKQRSPIPTEKPKEVVPKRPAENVTNGANTRIFVNPNFVKTEPVSSEPPQKKSREKSPEKPVQELKAPVKPEKFFNLKPRPQQQRKLTPPTERRLPKTQPPSVPIQPTAALGTHAFNIPPPAIQPQVTRTASPNIATTNVPTTVPISIPATIPLNIPATIASIQSAMNASIPVTIPTIQSAMNASIPTTIPPPFVPSSMPPQTYLPPPQIRNEAPRLNLPSNNRIFVDGKAYEVFYLDNVAVIERNGVPHRISFCGPPRDVIIDGVAHRMSFGETKTVVIDGQTHYLKFGAPSRELYMGDFPFKGVFGGPPIAATINGRRHEIRLCGPPPEVKIEQDPCYELMRHMQNMRQSNTSELSITKKENKEIGIGDLLAKLQKTGVLDSLSTAMKSTDKATTSVSTSSSVFYRESTPPIIPSNVKMDKFDVRESSAAPLSQFYMPDLKMRYLSVIRNIHNKRSTCPDCGIQFEDMDSTVYRNHMDEHIQTELNAMSKIQPMGKSRQKYFSAQEWIAYSKVDDVNRPPAIEMDDLSESGEESDEEETI